MKNALRPSAVLLCCAVAGCSCGPPPAACASDTDCPTGYFCALPDAVCTRILDAGDAAISDHSAPDVVEHEQHAIDGNAADGNAVDGARPDATALEIARTDTTALEHARSDGSAFDVTPADSAVVDSAVVDSAVADSAVADGAVVDQAGPDLRPLDAGGVDGCVPQCNDSCGGTQDGCGETCPDPCDSCTSTACSVEGGNYLCTCKPGHAWSLADRACIYLNDGALTLVAGQTFNLSAENSAGDASCADGVFFAVTDITGNIVGVDRDPGCCLGNRHPVLLINLQGAGYAPPNVGNYEIATVSRVDSNKVVLTRNFPRAFGASPGLNDNIGIGDGQQRVALIRIPHYTAVTVPDGAALTADPFNGFNGGVLALTSAGAINVNGAIDMAGAGYRGGALIINGSSAGFAEQGESIAGPGRQDPAANSGGGGGGCFDPSAWCGLAGGGGGHGTSGTFATEDFCQTTASLCNNPLANGGTAYAAADLRTRIHLGSGGGGSSADEVLYCSSGGNGGGIIMLESGVSIVVSATGSRINADGRSAENSESFVGGGGAGGSILLRAPLLALSTTRVTAVGGEPAWVGSVAGPRGGSGVIWVAASTIAGNTAPPYGN